MRPFRLGRHGLRACPRGVCPERRRGGGLRGARRLHQLRALGGRRHAACRDDHQGASPRRGRSDLVRAGARLRSESDRRHSGRHRAARSPPRRSARAAWLCRGSVERVTVDAQTTAVVALVLQQVTPPTPFASAAPLIESFVASSRAVPPEGVGAPRRHGERRRPGRRPRVCVDGDRRQPAVGRAPAARGRLPRARGRNQSSSPSPTGWARRRP